MFTTLQLITAALFALQVNAGSPSNVIAASTSGALSSLKYSNVGGSGSYDQVVNMVAGAWPSCTVQNHCQTAPKSVSGNLAPFDEELTMVFRAPMTLNNIAVYQPANTSAQTWSKVSSWSLGSQPDNLVFMNNKGGSKSGEWDSKSTEIIDRHHPEDETQPKLFLQLAAAPVNHTPMVISPMLPQPQMLRHTSASSQLEMRWFVLF